MSKDERCHFSGNVLEIRKFQIEIKNFWKNETVSIDKNNCSFHTVGMRFGDPESVLKIPLLKTKMAIYSITYLFSQEYKLQLLSSELMHKILSPGNLG